MKAYTHTHTQSMLSLAIEQFIYLGIWKMVLQTYSLSSKKSTFICKYEDCCHENVAFHLRAMRGSCTWESIDWSYRNV